MSEAAKDEERETLTVVTLNGGRSWRIDEYIEQEGEDPETESVELTEDIGFAPDFLLVSEQRNRIVCAKTDGSLAVLEASREDTALKVRQRKNVFTENADIHNTPRLAWRDIVNTERDDEGYDTLPGQPKLAVVKYLLGDETIIFADNWGGVQAWFTVQHDEMPKRHCSEFATMRRLRKRLSTSRPVPFTSRSS